jgi:mitochondrial fission protein ELM1
MLGLVEALGWPYEEKQLAFGFFEYFPNLVKGASLLPLDVRRSDRLTPPWPDLVVSASKRSVSVALWIRARAGGGTRLVHIGRPWAPLRRFDLIVTTPQYRLPRRYNILHATLPLHRVTPAKLQDAAATWAPRLRDLPRPWTVLLVGGSISPYRFDASAGAQLARAANAFVGRRGGSLLVTSSRRTSQEAMTALTEALTVPTTIHGWEQSAADNPYLGYLALADDIIVTGDSASMLAEACSTGKPVHIFDLPRRPLSLPPSAGWHGAPAALSSLIHGLTEIGAVTPARDMSLLHDALIRRGLAVKLSDEPAQPRSEPDDLRTTVERVLALFPAASDAVP